MGNYPVLPSASVKRTSDDAGLDDNAENASTTKRRRVSVKSSRHIYEALFLNGEGSDVTIYALGRSWPLHKVVLRQSGYFNSMFSGNWQESDKRFVDIDIPDENINEEALMITFGSFYKDDVHVKLSNVVGVLAASTLFDMQDLSSECANLMVENINLETVCCYYTVAVNYGQTNLNKYCVQWLERNILTSQSVELLRDIGVGLMAKLVSCPDLFVIQVETDVYAMLRKWLFLQLTDSDWTGSVAELTEAADKFIRSKDAEWSSGDKGCFLRSAEGSEYLTVFQSVRFQHIVTDYNSAKVLALDHIIPQEWLTHACSLQWQTALKLDNGSDSGPVAIDENIFRQHSLRCGRIIPALGDYCWRWTGFSFGFDLVMSFTGRVLLLKRNTTSRKTSGFISFQAERSLIYKVTVTCLNKHGRPQFVNCTGLKLLTLRKDEESILMSFDRNVPFPLHVSCNFLLHTPQTTDSSFISTLHADILSTNS